MFGEDTRENNEVTANNFSSIWLWLSLLNFVVIKDKIKLV